MKEPIWIATNVVLAVHDRLLAEHGGLEGLRDIGLLESALSRPRQMFSYEHPDFAALAAFHVAGIEYKHVHARYCICNTLTKQIVRGLFVS